MLSPYEILAFTWALFTMYSFYDGSWYSWHPVLMSFAFLGLLPNAIFRRHTLKQNVYHSYVNWTAWLVMLAGYYVIFTSKSSKNRPHLTTWHSWAGITVIAIFSVLSCYVTVAVWPKEASYSLLPGFLAKRGSDRYWHRKTGLWLYLGIVLTTLSGIGKESVFGKDPDNLFGQVLFYGTLTVTLVFFVTVTTKWGAQNFGAVLF